MAPRSRAPPRAQGAITNNGTLEIAGAATLLNDIVTNNGTVKVDDGQTLTLSGTEITGGTINNYSGASAALSTSPATALSTAIATLNTTARVTVESGVTLTLGRCDRCGHRDRQSRHSQGRRRQEADIERREPDGRRAHRLGHAEFDRHDDDHRRQHLEQLSARIDARRPVALVATTSATAITNGGTLRANGAELDINGEAVTNTGTLAAINNGTLKLISNDRDQYRLVTVSIEFRLDARSLGRDHRWRHDHHRGHAGIDRHQRHQQRNITNTGTISVTSGTLTIDPAVAPHHHQSQADPGEWRRAGYLQRADRQHRGYQGDRRRHSEALDPQCHQRRRDDHGRWHVEALSGRRFDQWRQPEQFRQSLRRFRLQHDLGRRHQHRRHRGAGRHAEPLPVASPAPAR